MNTIVDEFGHKVCYVKKTKKDAKTPTRAHEKDTGFDLFSTEDFTLKRFQRHTFDTGVIAIADNDVDIQIRSKSGQSNDYGIIVLNSPGTIDYGYAKGIGVILINLGEDDYEVKKGMKIGQMVLAKYWNEMEVKDAPEGYEVPKSDRGTSGFGDSGQY